MVSLSLVISIVLYFLLLLSRVYHITVFTL